MDKERVDYVKVVSSGMNFEMVDEISAGWTTFRYVNSSYDTHFFILEKLPDDVRIDKYQKEFLIPFKKAYDYFLKGDLETGNQQFNNLPEWSSRMEICGGVALTSPENTSQTTLYLETGIYIMECYVRMPDGIPHVFHGMLKEFTVSNIKNRKPKPSPDEEITISSSNGITFVDTLEEGNYTFSVDFIDQKVYEHMLGHDVNLVKIENENQLIELNNWLNLVDYSSFRTPAPKGLTFLGGVEDLFGDKKGYFTATLKKGEYVLVSEIPNVLERKMFKRFSVISKKNI